MPTTQQLLEVIRIQSDIASLGADLAGVMTHVVEQLLPLLHAEGAAIEFAEGDEMVYRAVSGVAKPSLGLRLRRTQSLSGLCVALGETLRADDTEVDPRVDQAACRRLGIRSMLVMPLHHQDTTVGVLKVMSAQPGKFTDDDATVLELLSSLIASAMFFASKYDMQDLFYKATHDAMTGLANRALFMDRLHATRRSSNSPDDFRPVRGALTRSRDLAATSSASSCRPLIRKQGRRLRCSESTQTWPPHSCLMTGS